MHHFNWSSVVSSLPTLWTGAIITFKITLLALVFGILWGTVLALLRLSGIKPLEWFAKGYVTLFRTVRVARGSVVVISVAPPNRARQAVARRDRD